MNEQFTQVNFYLFIFGLDDLEQWPPPHQCSLMCSHSMKRRGYNWDLNSQLLALQPYSLATRVTKCF
jgi:hypothetical protein